MIVKCEQCQTRFKIPDDKVTDKGVKVRCTKCAHTFRVTRDMAQPATATVPALGAPPPGPASDPFARFGAVAEPPMNAEVTRPGVFALGVEATKSPDLGARPLVPAMPAASPPYPSKPASSAMAFDFSSLAPPSSAPPLPAAPASVAPAPATASPFDFAAIAPPPAAAAPAQPAAFDFSTFAVPHAAPVAAPVPSVQPVAPPPAFDFSAPAMAPAQPGPFDFAPPAAPAPAAAPVPAFDFGPPLRAQSSAPTDDATTQQMPSMGADGFFAAAEQSATTLPDVDGVAARAMFDMPPPPPAALPEVPMPEVAPPPVAPTAPVSAARGPSATPMVQAPVEDAPRRRGVVGIVINVVIAAVLVVALVVVGSAFLNEGKVTSESLSLENLKNTFAPSVELVASDVSNGLYETRAGRAVFFVRGDVTNRSANPVKVVVKAEIVEDGKVLRFGETWAGDPATPEEIFLIDGAEALEVLNRRVEKRALVVPPDATASFVVPFTEYPPELKGFRVRVSARAVAEPTAAK